MKRDYSEISRRVEALTRLNQRVDTIASIEDFPIYHVTLPCGAGSPTKVLLTAGVHGDEPGGVEAALRLLESDCDEITRDFDFSVVPCVNPTGYVRDTRETSTGVDINRAFEKDDVREAQILKQLLTRLDVACLVDFHEDWEATGFYMYEGKRDDEWIGAQVVRAVETVDPVDPDAEGDELISKGLYKVTEAWGTMGLAPHVLKFHAPHVMIFETPTSWTIDQRARAHRRALDAVLGYYKGIS